MLEKISLFKPHMDEMMLQKKPVLSVGFSVIVYKATASHVTVIFTVYVKPESRVIHSTGLEQLDM